MGKLRLSELTTIDKEIFDMARNIENMGIYLSLVSQLPYQGAVLRGHEAVLRVSGGRVSSPKVREH